MVKNVFNQDISEVERDHIIYKVLTVISKASEEDVKNEHIIKDYDCKKRRSIRKTEP